METILGKKTKVMINSEQPSSVQIMIYQNNWRKWPISDIWGAWWQMMEDVHLKLNQGWSFQKQHSTRSLFSPANWTNILRKKLVKWYIGSPALYSAETWTVWVINQVYLESFKLWCWRKMEKISWTDHVRNEEVLYRDEEERNILRTYNQEKLTGFIASYVGTAF